MRGGRSRRRDGAGAPSRKPSNKGGVRKNIGKFPSRKAGRNIWWESLLERDYIHLLEFDTDVVTYVEQPFRVSYRLEGRGHYYTPDFLVERKNKQQVVEVKLKEKASSEAFRLFRLAVEPEILKLGYEFVVITEETIRINPFLANVKILRGYARALTVPRHQVVCRQFLRKNCDTSIADLTRALSDEGVTLSVVYSLIYQGALAVDLNLPLDPENIVRPAALVSTLSTKGRKAGRA